MARGPRSTAPAGICPGGLQQYDAALYLPVMRPTVTGRTLDVSVNNTCGSLGHLIIEVSYKGRDDLQLILVDDGDAPCQRQCKEACRRSGR